MGSTVATLFIGGPSDGDLIDVTHEIKSIHLPRAYGSHYQMACAEDGSLTAIWVELPDAPLEPLFIGGPHAGRRDTINDGTVSVSLPNPLVDGNPAGRSTYVPVDGEWRYVEPDGT